MLLGDQEKGERNRGAFCTHQKIAKISAATAPAQQARSLSDLILYKDVVRLSTLSNTVHTLEHYKAKLE